MGGKRKQCGTPDFPAVSFYQRFTAFFPLRSYDNVISVSTSYVFKQCLFCDVLLLEITDFHRTRYVFFSFSPGIHNATNNFLVVNKKVCAFVEKERFIHNRHAL